MTKEMTSAERLWAALNGQEPDRVPIWMLYPRERLGYYVDVHNLPSYARIMPHIWDRTDWLDRRNIASGTFYTAAADVETTVEVRDGRTITRRLNPAEARSILSAPKSFWASLSLSTNILSGT